MSSNASRMVVITSNEELIAQFSSDPTLNTRVIDLDDSEQVQELTKERSDLFNLAFFAQLADQNSNEDRVYREVLHSSSSNTRQPKSSKIVKKASDSTCRVCLDRAIGFNYDVLSCASCKAFFRRNAQQNLKTIRCLTGEGRCSIEHHVRRKCQRCRLERCFAVGMRKDFLLSEEEKQRRRRRDRLQENRSTNDTNKTQESARRSPAFASVKETLDDVDQLIMELEKEEAQAERVDESSKGEENLLLREEDLIEIDDLYLDDWIALESVRSAFDSSFATPDQQAYQLDVSDRSSALISWSIHANRSAMAFIHFFRQIEHFEHLNVDDRFVLIKSNLLLLFPVLKSFHLRPTNDCCTTDGNAAATQHQKFFALCGESDGIREEFAALVKSIVRVTEQDPTVISLLLLVCLFSRGSSIDDDQLALKEPVSVHHAQSFYAELLWKDLLRRHGPFHAIQRFIALLQVILRVQMAAKRFRDFFRSQLLSLDSVDQVTPLMQTVLHIS